VKLVMTLLVRDEADIIDAQIAFHLHAGVDFMIVTDNASQDATTEICKSYAADGHLHLIREDRDDMRQGEWVTRMARLAATEFGADWVINSDADEFWCSHGAAIKDVLAEVPKRFDTVRALMRNFVPRPGNSFFADRMNVRLVPGEAAWHRYRVHPFHGQDKVIHRAHPEVTVTEGNHDARWPLSADLRGSWPFEVLHFPMRSVTQCKFKWRNYERHGYSGYDILTVFDPQEYYESLMVEDEALARGVDSGLFAIDNRFRDALRTIRLHDGNGGRVAFRAPNEGPALYIPALTTEEAAALAADAATRSERDVLVKMDERLREFEHRLADMERSPGHRLRAGLHRWLTENTPS
jgi:glycosyl transferase family 2